VALPPCQIKAAVQAPVLCTAGVVGGMVVGVEEGMVQVVGQASPPVMGATGVVRWVTGPMSVGQGPRNSKRISLRRARRLHFCSC
jgi:hypothetical protein